MARRSLSLLFGFLLYITSLVTMICSTQEAFSYQVELDTEGNVYLTWNIKQDVITMELEVKALGFVAVGFSPSGGMAGADIVFAWVKDGKVYFKDMYAEGNMQPIEDPSQDYELTHASQNDTHTKVSFRRNLITCDAERDMPLSADTIRVIWAYSDVDDVVYHGPVTRGVKSLFLMAAVQSPWEANNIEDYKTWDVTFSNLSVPSDRTTFYWCTLFKIPETATKHQIVGFASEITKGNEAYVHHFLLYQCVHPEGRHLHDEAFGPYVGDEGRECFGPNMPDAFEMCEITILAWAIGGQGHMFPDHVGVPMGSKYGGYDYFMFEVHYDNPLKTEGIVDSSGMKIFYTDKLREYDSGTIELGVPVTPLQVVPPGQASFTTAGSCDKTCTTKALPADGIRVFQVNLHAHTFGRAIKVRQFRGGKEISALDQDNYYDFDYQQTRAIEPERVILPGDELQVECIYETEGRETPVYGGLSTEDEMCLVYLSYYPKIALGKCQSVPSPDDLASAVGVSFNPGVEWPKYDIFFGLFEGVLKEKLSGDLSEYNLLEFLYGGVEWNADTVARFQSAVVENKHYMVCYSTESKDFYEEAIMNHIPSKDIETFKKYGAETVLPERCNQKKKDKRIQKNESPLKSYLLEKFGLRYQG